MSFICLLFVTIVISLSSTVASVDVTFDDLHGGLSGIRWSDWDGRQVCRPNAFYRTLFFFFNLSKKKYVQNTHIHSTNIGRRSCRYSETSSQGEWEIEGCWSGTFFLVDCISGQREDDDVLG